MLTGKRNSVVVVLRREVMLFREESDVEVGGQLPGFSYPDLGSVTRIRAQC